jgi:hypothetical protein
MHGTIIRTISTRFRFACFQLRTYAAPYNNSPVHSSIGTISLARRARKSSNHKQQITNKYQLTNYIFSNFTAFVIWNLFGNCLLFIVIFLFYEQALSVCPQTVSGSISLGVPPFFSPFPLGTSSLSVFAYI